MLYKKKLHTLLFLHQLRLIRESTRPHLFTTFVDGLTNQRQWSVQNPVVINRAELNNWLPRGEREPARLTHMETTNKQ
jgi:hypothetical protein